jgi:hypothetical protein
VRKILVALALCALAAAASAAEESPALAGLQRWLDGTKGPAGPVRAVPAVERARCRALGVRPHLPAPPRPHALGVHGPESKIAVLVDDRTQLYIAEEKRLHVAQLPKDDASLAGLLAGTQPLSALFVATSLPDEGGRTRLKLVPKSPTSRPGDRARPRSQDLGGGAGGAPGPGGNRMAYTFTALKRNAGVPDSLFRLNPPRGTEVVEGL